MEQPLIADKPYKFRKVDLKKLRKQSKEDLLSVFYSLAYPASTWFYHNVLGVDYENKGLSTKEQLKFLKHLCINDLYYFAKKLLKKYKLRERPNRLMAEKIMIRHTPEEQERKLICEPRGTYKTTIGSIAYPIWALCKHPNYSILIMSETDGQALEIYKTVREELENNTLLMEMFGQFMSNRWNEKESVIKQRKVIRRDPSLFHCGCDTSINGKHPDITIFDDPCSEQNTQSPKALEKVYDSYKLLTPLVEKDGYILVIMTRWVLDDLAGKILENERDSFSVISIKSCYGEDGHGESESEGAYAPEVLPLSYLRKAKRMGMWRFSANYLNDPKPDVDKSFNKDWLMYYTGDVPLERNADSSLSPIPLSIFTSIDASWADIHSDTGKDPTAIITAGFDPEGNIFILDVFCKRITPTEVINKLFDVYSQYQFEALVSEDIGTQKGINKLLEQEMTKRSTRFQLDRVKHQARSKGARIMSLTYLFENGSIFIKKEMTDFIEQYEYFNPTVSITHDDILDALEMLVDTYRENHVTPNKRDDFDYDEAYADYDPVTGRM